MAQKNKVKELVGRGLHSYHTKALQQMDRIEKKNKEQNHKISILSNELDNDYLTKTEEGSVISLEHSKEGMVYLDELQGNTLVNYCTDGSKEMTLNGDIDVEGTFVTTTEGVDGGKIDVMCEGNTLVNLGGKVNKQSNRFGLLLSSTMILKPSTLYTFIVTNLGNQSVQFYRNESVFNATTDRSKVVPANSTIVFTWETLSNLTDNGLIKSEMDGATQFTLDVVLLEGDWTNREIPQYFEGMKSVGQDDINGHKIEILSSVGKPNLIKNSGFLNSTSNYSFHNGSKGEVIDDASSQSGKILKITTGTNGGVSGPFQANIVKHIEDKKYTLSGWCKGEVGTTLGVYIERHKSVSITFTNDDWVRFVVTSEQNPTNWNRTITFYSSNTSKIFYLKDIKMEESENDTPYVPHTTEKNYNSFNKINKKEILLNESLRGLPNGVKDRFVKIGDKWYIERNCREVCCNGNEDWTYVEPVFKLSTVKYPHKQDGDLMGWGICDKYTEIRGLIGSLDYAFKVQASWLQIRNKDCIDLQSFKTHLQNNPIKIIYQLETPTYEPLEINSELSCYTDITHISNNSIIPCNMKVQNSGYNAIIKPSTLYTIALDTNKSGTIGMNLGGVKGTTTNNVLTLTTPATLTDDSLRLYGKGIKGSKVRLLEGDKTNWIPSYFEGMKSSFEDKLQDDGSYKMEILMNNRNLFDINGRTTTSNDVSVEKNNNTLVISNENKQATWQQHNIFIKGLQHNKTYLVTMEDLIVQNNFEQMDRYAISVYEETRNLHLSSVFDVNKKQIRFSVPLGAKLDKISLRIHLNSTSAIVNKITIKNIQISEVDKNIIDRKFNKIQFSSIEPLRKWDRFVFKDNKLMIERGSKEVTLDGSSDELITINNPFSTGNYNGLLFGLNDKKFGQKNIISNNFPNINYSQVPITKGESVWGEDLSFNCYFSIHKRKGNLATPEDARQWLSENPQTVTYELAEPTYEEIPFELQKIILEGYENGTLFFDTNIPPTATVTYAGETPIVKATKLNKTEVLNNTEDINDNIIPYLMDMDYRVVMLQLATEELEGGVSMARLFGGTYEMIKRDILSKRLTREEYGYRLADYFNAGKLTEEQVRELEELR